MNKYIIILSLVLGGISSLSFSSNLLLPQFDTVCTNSLALHVENPTTGYWTAYQDGSISVVDYNPSNTDPFAVVTIPDYEGLNAEYDFFWQDDSGSSSNYSIHVVFVTQPIANVGVNNEIEICGNCVQLDADTIGYGWAFGFWFCQDFVYSLNEYNIPNPNLCVDINQYFGDSAHVSSDIKWVMRYMGCQSVDSLTATFYEVPVANAGLDNSICGNSYQLGGVYSIEECVNYTPNSSWQVYSKPNPEANVDIASMNNDTSNVFVSHFGIYEFIFTEYNAFLPSCYSTDTVMIEFVEIPIVSAGEDRDVCGNCTDLQGISSGFVGTWYASGVAFDDYTDPNTNVCVPASGGEKVFLWIETNNSTLSSMGCSDSDDVTITFWAPPTSNIITPLEDSLTCGLIFENLESEYSVSNTTGYWLCDDINAIYSDPFSQYSSVTVPSYGYHNFYWVEQSGPEITSNLCSDTSDVLTINFLEYPNANAGNDTLGCGECFNLQAIPSIGVGTWITNSSSYITITNDHNPNSIICTNFFNVDDEDIPYYEVIWKEDNNSCSSKDTVNIAFAPIPGAELDIIPSMCFGGISMISAEENDLPRYIWNFYEGTSDDTIPSNLEGGYYKHFVDWNDNESFHLVSLQTKSFYNCYSEINIDTVYEPAIKTFNYSIISDSCMQGNGTLLMESNPSCAFYWLNENYGPESGSLFYTAENLIAGVYFVETIYETLNTNFIADYNYLYDNYYCYETVPFFIENYSPFEIFCPEDMEIIEPGITLFPAANPYGGSYYINDIQVDYFNADQYENGIYEVEYIYYDIDTDCNGICSFSVNLNCNTSSIFTETINYSVYPNPNNGNFNISFTNNYESTTYRILNTNGKIIDSGKIESSTKEISLDVPAGIYFLQLINKNNITVEKIVIQ